MDQQLNILSVYTAEDAPLVDHFLTRKQSLNKEFAGINWMETPIPTGEYWVAGHTSQLSETDVFLLFVSNAFMHSSFINQMEFKHIIDRYKANNAIVVPILIDDCPWDIDFNSDDYSFSMKELQVLPKNQNPIKNWKASEPAFEAIEKDIDTIIASKLVRTESKPAKIVEPPIVLEENQTAIDFSKVIDTSAELEAKTKINVEKQELQAKALKEAAELEKIKVQKLRLQKEEEAEIKRVEALELQKKEQKEEQQRQQREAELQKQEELELLRKQEIEEQQLAEELRNQKAAAEEAKRVAEQKQNEALFEQEKEAAAQRAALLLADENENISNDDFEAHEAEEPNEASKPDYRKLLGILLLALAAIGIYVFYDSEKNSRVNDDEEVAPIEFPVTETADEIENELEEEETVEIEVADTSKQELKIGDSYEGGIVIVLNEDGTSGKIAHQNDVGPMSWSNANNIEEQLGVGWRLPSIDELVIMYKTIGHGGTNSGGFEDELYWSATAYDRSQARLLKFTNGNTTYHYNKLVDYRKFRVRAIRDFNR